MTKWNHQFELLRLLEFLFMASKVSKSHNCRLRRYTIFFSFINLSLYVSSSFLNNSLFTFSFLLTCIFLLSLLYPSLCSLSSFLPFPQSSFFRFKNGCWHFFFLTHFSVLSSFRPGSSYPILNASSKLLRMRHTFLCLTTTGCHWDRKWNNQPCAGMNFTLALATSEPPLNILILE